MRQPTSAEPVSAPDRPKAVNIYTDGACIGNPGPGGYGVVLRYGDREKELSGGYRRTTNNRMELLAAIVGLEALKEPCRVTLNSDSEYVVKAMRLGWARRWQAQGWRQSTGQQAANPDLWTRLLVLCDAHHVAFQWVRGHAGNPGNERADRLALAAARGSSLQADDEYERLRPRTRGPRQQRR